MPPSWPVLAPADCPPSSAALGLVARTPLCHLGGSRTLGGRASDLVWPTIFSFPGKYLKTDHSNKQYYKATAI